jgi:hypothetical protein
MMQILIVKPTSGEYILEKTRQLAREMLGIGLSSAPMCCRQLALYVALSATH